MSETGKASSHYRSINPKPCFTFISCFCVVPVTGVFDLCEYVNLLERVVFTVKTAYQFTAHPSSTRKVDDLSVISMFPESVSDDEAEIQNLIHTAVVP